MSIAAKQKYPQVVVCVGTEDNEERSKIMVIILKALREKGYAPQLKCPIATSLMVNGPEIPFDANRVFRSVRLFETDCNLEVTANPTAVGNENG